jgi:hypothetical protein
MRPRTAVAAVVATGAAAGGAWQLAAGDTVRDVGIRLDLRERPPLELRLGGPLWSDRTLRDSEGARDVAYVLRDAPLEVTIVGRDGGRPGNLVVRVDGHVVSRRRLCHSAPCPAHARVTLTPAVGARGPGLHRLSLRATGTRPRDSARSTFEVTVGRKLSALEAEPVVRRAGRPARPPVSAGDRRRALAVIERERRWGVLRGVLGSSFYDVAEVGRLRGGRARDVGVTVLLTLPVARAARAQVPAYVPEARAASGFRLRQVTLSAPLLRDLLVDVDLTNLRVVAAEPGPSSRTDGAQGVAGPTPVESPADAPRADPELIRLSDAGPSFMAYDGTASLDRGARDWAVSLIFTGHATVGKVKRALRGVGFTHSGRPSYLPYRAPPGGLRFDGDRGVKTGCDPQGTDLHLRLYAPSATDRFVDPEYGDVVVATAHHDRGDGCGHPPALFGFSESAEQRIADIVSRRLGWQVRPDHLALGNPEPYRRDIGDSAHVWWSDGRATLIAVP